MPSPLFSDLNFVKHFSFSHAFQITRPALSLVTDYSNLKYRNYEASHCVI